MTNDPERSYAPLQSIGDIFRAKMLENVAISTEKRARLTAVLEEIKERNRNRDLQQERDDYWKSVNDPSFVSPAMLARQEVSTCKRCCDVTYLKLPDGTLYPCPCNPNHPDRKSTEARIEAAHIPPLYKDMTWGTIDDVWLNQMKQFNPGIMDAYEAAKEMGSGSNSFHWLVLFGDVGWGKTSLAVCVLRQRIEAKRPALFVTGDVMLAELQMATMDDAPRVLHNTMKFYQEHPFMVIDDLGTRKGSEWTVSQEYAVLDYRRNSKLETIITSNASITRFESRVADRLMSSRDGFCSVHDVGGVSSYRSGERQR